MAAVLDGLVVLEVTSAQVASLTTMLLGVAGAGTAIDSIPVALTGYAEAVGNRSLSGWLLAAPLVAADVRYGFAPAPAVALACVAVMVIVSRGAATPGPATPDDRCGGAAA